MIPIHVGLSHGLLIDLAKCAALKSPILPSAPPPLSLAFVLGISPFAQGEREMLDEMGDGSE